MTNRNYKDGLFTTLFGKRDKILELFNALQDTHYGADTEVQIQTLSEVLYYVRKNDLAFSINNRFVVLAEHQSTICANLALRFLSYAPRVYEKMVDKRLVYSKTRLDLPTPEFYVFYNGTDDFPAESIQRLSDSFIAKPQGGTPLELEVKIININPDKKHTILDKSATLYQYGLFVDKVRYFLKQKLSRDEAIRQAIDWAIDHDVLEEFLKNNGTEVRNMLFEEYNVETALQVAREDERTSFALKLLCEGFADERVSRLTELPVQQIAELRKTKART